jgi:hypothetical protein
MYPMIISNPAKPSVPAATLPVPTPTLTVPSPVIMKLIAQSTACRATNLMITAGSPGLLAGARSGWRGRRSAESVERTLFYW